MTDDDAPIGEFLDAIASDRVAPAGGTAAAVTGATGAALCEMVCVHTTAAMADGRSGVREDADATFPDAEVAGDGTDRRSLPELRAGLRRRRRKLLALGEQDGRVVDALFGDDGEPSARLRRRAAGVPLAVSESALRVLIDAETVHRRGRSGVAADALTGAYLADATIRASLRTVRINTAALPDRSFAADLEERAADVEASASAVRVRLFGDEA